MPLSPNLPTTPPLSPSIPPKSMIEECSSSTKLILLITRPSPLDLESNTPFNTPNLAFPRHEHAPLFAHEICQPQSAPNRAPSELHNDCSRPSPVRSTSNPIHAEPAIEEFPTEAEAILRQLEETKTRISVDVTEISGSPPSPVVDMDVNKRSGRPITFLPLSSGSSPTLESISEERR
jgi:hypothetical protein